MVSEVKTEKTVKTKKNKMQRGSNVFYVALMAFPVIQFILFYIVVNFKSFGYAFMEQEKIEGGIVWHVTFKNIMEWFSNSSNLKDLWYDNIRITMVRRKERGT